MRAFQGGWRRTRREGGGRIKGPVVAPSATGKAYGEREKVRREGKRKEGRVGSLLRTNSLPTHPVNDKQTHFTVTGQAR